MALSLVELCQNLVCTGLLPAHQSVMIHDIVTDSRRVSPASLFVALKGQRTDGLLFVDDAIARGASAILTDYGPQRGWDSPVPVLLVKDARAILGPLAQRLYDDPAQHLRLHAITGTNGKTTTAYMLASLLRHLGHQTAFWTTNSVEGGALRPFRPTMTTPEAPDLYQFLRDVANSGVEDVIVEVSSHALQLGRINGLTFDSVALNNITPDHLDFHKTYAAYVKAKASLLHYLKPNGIAVLNRDDETIASLNVPSTVRRCYVGLNSSVDVSAKDITLGDDFSEWTWMLKGEPGGTIYLPIPGLHNVMNALVALAMISDLGCHPTTVQEAFKDFTPPPRRLQTRHVGRYTIVSDVAMNRGSYDAVMQTVQRLNQPLIVISAIRGNRGDEVNRDIANVLADWNDTLHYAPLFATASETYIRHLAVDYRVRRNEMQAFEDQAKLRGLPIRVYRELPQAIRAACAQVPRKGGVLLLLGTYGMDSGMDLAHSILRARERHRS